MLAPLVGGLPHLRTAVASLTLGVPIDAALATGGYLRSMHGEVRAVQGLGELMRAAKFMGARFLWGYPPAERAAVTQLFSRTTVVHPRVYRWPAEYVCDVFSHELGHVACGRCCVEAREWQREWYGHLLPEGELERWYGLG